jgi:hypothetical protein
MSLALSVIEKQRAAIGAARAILQGRLGRDVKADDIAKRVNLCRNAIPKMESGDRKMTPDDLELLAVSLDAEIEYGQCVVVPKVRKSPPATVAAKCRSYRTAGNQSEMTLDMALDPEGPGGSAVTPEEAEACIAALLRERTEIDDLIAMLQPIARRA